LELTPQLQFRSTFAIRTARGSGGANEKTNGLLRQYLGKSQDLRQLSQADLDLIADEMNGRPRKTLGWSTPAQTMNRVLEKSQSTASTEPDVEDSPGGVTSTP
jgi:IS30 family transposase